MTVHQFFYIYIFVTLVPFAVRSWYYRSQQGVRLKCYYAYFLVRCGCDTSYIVSVLIQCQASIYTLSLCRGHSWQVRLAKQETLTPPGHLVSPLLCRGPWLSIVVLYCWCHSDSASVLMYFTFSSYLFPLPCGAGSTVPREGSDSSVIMPFFGVLWLWHFLYSVGPRPVSSLHVYTLLLRRDHSWRVP